MKNSLNILIGGEAGQGLVTIGELLAKSLVRSGYSIVVTQSYQSRIRGGHNTYMIRVSPEEISSSPGIDRHSRGPRPKHPDPSPK